MGRIFCLKTEEIKPSQDFLKEDTVKHILSCYRKKCLDRLPPIPIVKWNDAQSYYIAIDGHNLIAVKEVLFGACDVYIADHAEDGLSIQMFPNTNPKHIAARNADLRKKFSSIDLDTERISNAGIKTFSDLRAKYLGLFSQKEQ